MGKRTLRKLKSTDNCVAIESNNSHFQFYFSFAKGQETRKTGQLYLQFAMHYDFLKKWVNKSYGNGSKAQIFRKDLAETKHNFLQFILLLKWQEH